MKEYEILDKIRFNLIGYKNGKLSFEELEFTIKTAIYHSGSSFINTQYPPILHKLREYPDNPDIINKIIHFTEVALWNMDIWWSSEDLLCYRSIA